MKKLLFPLALLFGLLTTAQAQTEKGSRLAGVQVGNIIIPTSGGSGAIIALQPTYGWFVADNLAIGVGIPFFHVGAGGSDITQIGVAPFLRYYLSTANVKPFLGASVGVVNTSGQNRSSTDALYSATGGVAIFINKAVSFDIGLTYTGGSTGAISTLLAGGANSLTPNVPNALNISLGFQVFFGPK